MTAPIKSTDGSNQTNRFVPLEELIIRPSQAALAFRSPHFGGLLRASRPQPTRRSATAVKCPTLARIAECGVLTSRPARSFRIPGRSDCFAPEYVQLSDTVPEVAVVL